MMTTTDEARNAIGDRLYDEYAKPLEPKHRGKYIAVSEAGRTVLGTELLDVSARAWQELGPSHYVFKVGPRAVGKWR